MTYTPPPFPTGIGPGKSKPSAKTLQAALKAAGYLAFGVTLSDTYGPYTKEAVQAFQRTNVGAYGPVDGVIGPVGWHALFVQAYGGAAKPSGTAEPAGDYTKVVYGGHTVNVRTRTLLERARVKLGLTHELRLLQGSYNTSVAASAGTHAGGGVVDVDPTQADHWAIVKALREVGFAAWYRVPGEGPWSYHIHSCAIGDARMASSARSQVRDYFNGRSGLVGERPDSAPASVGRPYPAWASRYR